MSPLDLQQSHIDQANARFWNELCGSHLAKALGITDDSPDSLAKFDRYYMDMYPYLLKRVPAASFSGKRVLEIGLGFGTLGAILAKASGSYSGLDIASGPVAMMQHRLRLLGIPGAAVCGSMLECPFEEASFDVVVSIGCFHHTGSIARCVEEAARVLVPGGKLYFMVYNRYSYRQWQRWPRATWAFLLREFLQRRDSQGSTAEQRFAYDSNAAGDAAPETEFASIRGLRRLLRRSFGNARFFKENNDPVMGKDGSVMISREKALPWLGRLAGLDIYVSACKRG